MLPHVRCTNRQRGRALEIPVLDLQKAQTSWADVLDSWESAVLTTGCFQLVNHGIPPEVLETCLAAARDFHGRDSAFKQRYAMSRSLNNRGYVPADFRPTGTESRRVVRDYASLDLGTALADAGGSIESILLGPNVWPDISGFRQAVESYYQAVHACALATSRMLSRVCGLDADHLAKRSEQGISLLRLLHYPSPAWDPADPPNGHTDYEWFTLIWQSSAGLEVLGRDGRVHLVPEEPGALVVILGDLLEVLTGGWLESTLHWVRPRQPDRHSLTYFFGPDFHEVVAPVAPRLGPQPERYPLLPAGEHLTALRVRHFAHLRAAVRDGSLDLPFELPAANPLKAVKQDRLEAVERGRA
ncbi:2-oxoglutarate and iron-dependent oxygenase domain-containing protein [Nonomuraea purpurea]|uniref:2-oxoglutarate and iron-dependent oxygenase domain-containing protein n=1 Tax=Nonomuraea purpurea TaxID=1849276 RepID=A0ABV8GRM2_9ACTN